MDISYIPQYHYKRIEDITLDDIHSWGVKGIGIDIDNTVCYDATAKFIGNSKSWIESVKNAGIPVVIITNTNKPRARLIARKLKLPFIGRAGKPKTDGFKSGADIIGIETKDLAFIGDQIFSDIKGANDAGAVSVYVEPPAKEILFFFFYRIRRYMERPHIKNMHEVEKNSEIPHKVRDR